ncbi:hypothetical protein ACJ73_04532 [Blastomyces percursus]|uniref:Uncharacterized protein n=1 Tax=Blastomyces percursus TaxID=1658174 RepID=A0A1J9QV43_9EURO|nr:hypothetical protein ACJ73_04532 [Blastomyces percursus]
MTDGDTTIPTFSRLADSSYLSPYARSGAPRPHPNTDPYGALRSRALEAMGFDPKTMIEHGKLWAENQDIWACQPLPESYEEFLSKEELDGMIEAKTVVPLVRKYELDIRRQVIYPDSPLLPIIFCCRMVISVFQQDYIEPTRNNGTTVLFSLKQQAIVAEVCGSTTWT